MSKKVKRHRHPLSKWASAKSDLMRKVIVKILSKELRKP